MDRHILNANFGKVSVPWLKSFVKRVFDIVVSSIALFILAPLFGLIAVAIKRDTPGPVFYRGIRIGRWGIPFQILKFRTMYEDPESYKGPKVTAQGDPRITPVGKWLRDTKLNELPQFWNVLKGEMSLVGPRPEDPTFAKTWPTKIREEVLSVKPGITSPATVVYHDEEALLSSKNLLQQYIMEVGPDKLRLDQMYVHRQSLMLDMDILLWTFLILLPMIRETTPPEKLLFVGPVTRVFQRYMTWLTTDMIVTVLSISLTIVVWHTIAPIQIGWLRSLAMTIVFSLIFSSTGVAMGVNRIHWRKASIADVFNLVPAWLLAFIIVAYVDWSLGVFPLGLVAIAAVLSLGGFIFVRYFRRFMAGLIYGALGYTSRTNQPRERVLIVGSGRTAEHISYLLNHPSNYSKYEVVGFVDNDLFSQGMRIYGKKVIGTFSDIPQLTEKYQIDLVLLASHQLETRQSLRVTDHCAANAIKVVVIPDLYGSLNRLIEGSEDNPFVEHGDDIEFVCSYCIVKYASANDEISEVSPQKQKLELRH